MRAPAESSCLATHGSTSEVELPQEKTAKNEIKITDKRIFTADGDIRDEFRGAVKPADPPARPAPAPEPPPQTQEKGVEEKAGEPSERDAAERRRTIAERGTNPGTVFSAFIESLIVQAYMSLGMLRNPYQPQLKPDVAAARQMIDILNMLREKTAGNLTEEEADYLEAHLGDLKLAFVQKTKTI